MPDDDVPHRPALEKTPGRRTSATDPVVTVGGDADQVGPAGDEDGHDRERRRAPLWLETIVLLAVALGMALIIKTFFVQAFYIPSASMEPGLVENDRILVQKVSYWFDDQPDRGDVIVFEDPGGWLVGNENGPQSLLSKGLARIGLYPTGGHLVKRVIGVPGDTIECCDDQGRLIVNGVAIDEDSFIAEQIDCDGPMVNGCQQDWTVTVPDDRLFVMGDNRNASADSSDRLLERPCRGDGCDAENPFVPKGNTERPFVPVDNVVGKVFTLVWPLSHAEFIGRPEVFDSVPD